MAADPAPAFVACCARSGSTLLRFLVDAHPALSCPGESDLAALVGSYVQVASGLLGDKVTPPEVHRRAREMADGLVGAHLERVGKRRWCDKSLSNVFHLELLASLWPEARFVLLHRHAMDMVMSGLDASPWGLSEYGFAQVAQRSPTDSVVALAAYWVDRTARMLDFEARYPERCLRIRYEDLVGATGTVLAGLWDHLGVEAPPGETPGFGSGRPGAGPADHTIWYTDRIHREAVGRGARVPPDHVSGPLRASVNELLGRLGYDEVNDDWGVGRPAALGSAGDGGGVPDPGTVELRVVDGHAVLGRHLLDVATGREAEGARPAAIVAVERSALAGLASGGTNLGAALRARVVRYYGPPLQGFGDERRVFEGVRRFLGERGAELAGADQGPLG